MKIKTIIRVASDVKNTDGTRDRQYNVLNSETGEIIGHVFETWETYSMDYKNDARTLRGTLIDGTEIDGAQSRARTVANVRNAYVNAS